MRTIKTALVVVIGLALMLIMAANMEPVDLHLAPKAVGLDGLNIKAVPLALVIVISVLVGIILGLLLEFLREARHRNLLAEKRAEIARLKAENARLSKQAGVDTDELSLLPG
jgi:uncharacterized integral membrane protein